MVGGPPIVPPSAETILLSPLWVTGSKFIFKVSDTQTAYKVVVWADTPFHLNNAPG